MRISDWSSDVCSSDLAANRKFFERFEAVGGETRCEDRDALAGLAQGFEPAIGRGFEPFGAAEARLKGDLDRAPEQVGKQARGLLALAMIGIAEFQQIGRASGRERVGQSA